MSTGEIAEIDRFESNVNQNSEGWRDQAVEAWKNTASLQTNERNSLAGLVFLPSLSIVDTQAEQVGSANLANKAESAQASNQNRNSLPRTQGQEASSVEANKQAYIPKPPDLSGERLSPAERLARLALGYAEPCEHGQEQDDGKPKPRSGESGYQRPDDLNRQQQPIEPQSERAREEPRLTEREQRLFDRMRERGATEEELSTFRRDLASFRRRGPSEQEVSRTLDQVERLLNSEGNEPTTQEQRRRIGMQIVQHAARPADIDQGQHNTCNVTTLEERLFTTNPSRAAEMIVSASISGTWRAPDGRNIALDRGSFVPGREERSTYPAERERSHASQIFQLVAANDITQRRTPPQFYRQERPTDAADTGERLYYQDGRPVMVVESGQDRETPARDPRIYSWDIADAAHRLTGQRGFVLTTRAEGNDYGNNITQIDSRQQLVDRIQDLQRNGRLPAIIEVDANHPGISGEDATERGRGSWHVISITGYDPESDEFQISNQWGSGSDRRISSNDLFNAMHEWPRPAATQRARR